MMADDQYEARQRDPAWERECLLAARDRHGRRLGDLARQSPRFARMNKREPTNSQRDAGGDDIVLIHGWNQSSARRTGTGR